MRKLLYIDSSYTLSEIRQRGLANLLDVRKLDGYWDLVVSAHPRDLREGQQTDAGPYGPALIAEIDGHHYFMRGRQGRFSWLRWAPKVNSLFALLDFSSSVVRLARRERFEVVRGGNPGISGLIALVAARIGRSKLLIRIPADNDQIRRTIGAPTEARFFPTIRSEEFIERAVISRADAVIVPSENYAEFARSKGAREEQLSQVSYGNLIAPIHHLPAAERPPLADPYLVARLRERPWMFHIGRLNVLKHVEDCIAVLEHLNLSGFDVGLVLIGDGPLRDALAQRARRAGLEDQLLLLGNVGQEFLAEVLPFASVVLSPLTGRALVEAALAARPIVAYDLDWQGQLVESGTTGILVPARDTMAMAKGVAAMLSDSALAEKYGEAVRVRALESLSHDDASQDEKAVYERLVCDAMDEISPLSNHGRGGRGRRMLRGSAGGLRSQRKLCSMSFTESLRISTSHFVRDARATDDSTWVLWVFDFRIRYLAAMRLAEALLRSDRSSLAGAVGRLSRRLLKIFGSRRLLEIPPGVAGPGLSIAHFGPIVVNTAAQLGEECRLHAGVNIGYNDGGVPRIGNRCHLGPGAKIFGAVELGDDCIVGANAVVTRSFPSGMRLVGVPARSIDSSSAVSATGP